LREIQDLITDSLAIWEISQRGLMLRELGSGSGDPKSGDPKVL